MKRLIIFAFVMLLVLPLAACGNSSSSSSSGNPPSGSMGTPSDSPDDSTDQSSAQTQIPISEKEPGITLEEAKNKSGLYVMEDSLFYYVEGSPLQGKVMSIGEFSIKADAKSQIVTLGREGSNGNKEFYIVNEDFEIPQISSHAQLVIIGTMFVGSSYKFDDNGYTIQFPVAFTDPYRAYNVVENDYIRIEKPFNSSDAYGDVYTTINDKNPKEYRSRLLSDRYRAASSTSNQGIFTADKNEEFMFGCFKGTDWVETKYIANYRYFTHNNYEDYYPSSKLIQETRNGYFLYNFPEPPVGYYYLNYGGGIIVEFVDDEIHDAIHPLAADTGDAVGFTEDSIEAIDVFSSDKSIYFGRGNHPYLVDNGDSVSLTFPQQMFADIELSDEFNTQNDYVDSYRNSDGSVTITMGKDRQFELLRELRDDMDYYVDEYIPQIDYLNYALYSEDFKSVTIYADSEMEEYSLNDIAWILINYCVSYQRILGDEVYVTATMIDEKTNEIIREMIFPDTVSAIEKNSESQDNAGTTGGDVNSDSPSSESTAQASETPLKLVSLDYFTENIVSTQFSPYSYGEWVINGSGRIRVNSGDYYDSFIGLIQKNTSVLGANSYTVTGTIAYLLNGRYTSFSGIACLLYDYRSTERNGKIIILGDGGELYSTTEVVKGGYIPALFTVDVTNVTVLEIILEYSPNHNNSSCIGIANALLHT